MEQNYLNMNDICVAIYAIMVTDMVMVTDAVMVTDMVKIIF